MARRNEGLDAYVDLMERRILPPFLLGLVLLSAADRIWGLLPEGWSVPLVFFVLFLLLRWVGDVKERVRALAPEPPVRHYTDYVTFYEELGRAIGDAKRSVLATYEQVVPPSADTPEAVAYFERVCDWYSRRPGERTFQRLIRVPRENAAMEAWAGEEASTATRHRNYNVRFETCDSDRESGTSFVVVDQRTVFVAFFMDSGHEVRGHSIQGESVARDYEAFFRERWGKASRTPPVPASLGG